MVEHAIAVQNRKLSQGLAFDPPKLLFVSFLFTSLADLRRGRFFGVLSQMRGQDQRSQSGMVVSGRTSCRR